MTQRAVYDAMVFFQWAALPAHRQHRSIKAIYDGTIRLCLSTELVEEVRDLLSRPNIRAKSPQLTDERVAVVLAAAAKHADWFQHVPKLFTLRLHPDDDHLFNLAIEAQAAYLVTWETRLLGLRTAKTDVGKRLRQLAPGLSILTPKELGEALKRRPTR
jgi:predicted nucleic acid-binding protein